MWTAWALALTFVAGWQQGADDDRPTASTSAEATVAAGLGGSGSFRRTLLLSGELRAAEASLVQVPRTRAYDVRLQWMIEDGSEVTAGDRVAELDDTSLLSQLEDLRLAATEARSALAGKRFELEAEEAGKELAVEEARIELEKARIAASVPKELMSRREAEDRELQRRRAETAHAKARDEVEAQRESARIRLALDRLELERTERNIRTIEEDLGRLVLKAAEDGVILVERHPWRRRKIQVGDTVYPGFTLLSQPDLRSLEVRASLFDVDDGDLSPGMIGLCLADAYPAEPVRCRVTEITPVAKATSPESLRRAFEVRLQLQDAPRDWMRPGMSIQAAVETLRLEDVQTRPRDQLPPGREADGTPLLCNAHDCVVSEVSAEDLARAAPPPAVVREPKTAAGSPEVVDPRIQETVWAWAAAWTAQDVDRYLDFYSERFRPADGSSLADWRQTRRRRVAAPARIQVSLDDLQVELLEPGRARADFTQSFVSDSFRDVVRKNLDLVRERGEWRILEERVIPGQGRETP